jgi:hypothetical protein
LFDDELDCLWLFVRRVFVLHQQSLDRRPQLGPHVIADGPVGLGVALHHPSVAADFVVGVIITEQKCFGSAGCSYRYTINPQYISAKPLPDKTTVVFTVTGGEQDQVGNFTIDGDGTATFDRETSISGPEAADL